MAFFACGSVVQTVFFRRFGGKAAKTTERNVNFHAAAGEKRLLRREQPRDRVIRVNAYWPGQLHWQRYLPTIETEALVTAASLSVIYIDREVGSEKSFGNYDYRRR
jgi:hypothetical protein